MNFADYTSLLNEGDAVLSSDDISLMASLERACRNLSASMDEKICKLRACQRNLAHLEMRLEARRLDIERERKEVKKVRTNERTTKKKGLRPNLLIPSFLPCLKKTSRKSYPSWNPMTWLNAKDREEEYADQR